MRYKLLLQSITRQSELADGRGLELNRIELNWIELNRMDIKNMARNMTTTTTMIHSFSQSASHSFVFSQFRVYWLYDNNLLSIHKIGRRQTLWRCKGAYNTWIRRTVVIFSSCSISLHMRCNASIQYIYILYIYIYIYHVPCSYILLTISPGVDSTQLNSTQLDWIAICNMRFWISKGYYGKDE